MIDETTPIGEYFIWRGHVRDIWVVEGLKRSWGDLKVEKS